MKSSVPVLAFLVTVLLFSRFIVAQDRPTIPDSAARKAAAKEIREIYEEQFEKAKTVTEKRAFAKLLLKEAIATKDNPVSRYVLLRISRDVAAGADMPKVAFQAIDAISESHEIDALRLKFDVIKTCSKIARTKDSTKIIVEFLSVLIDAAITVDRYEMATELGDLALSSARKIRDRDASKRFVQLNKEIKAIELEFNKMEIALATLKENPADAAANLEVGKFRCFVKGDWQKGLPMLALGNDAVLKALAISEIKGAPKDRLGLGNSWWKLSLKRKGLAQENIQVQAAKWYQEALPDLTGIDSTKAKQRIKSIANSTTFRKLTKGGAATAPPRVLTCDVIQKLVSGQFARMKVLTGGAFEPLKEGAISHTGTRPYYWEKIPSCLHGMYYLHKKDNNPLGTTGFNISKPGVVLLAVTSRWGAGGGLSAADKSVLTTRDQLLKLGWNPVSPIKDTAATRHGYTMTVYARYCKKGEQFMLRTEKYVSPFIILK